MLIGVRDTLFSVLIAELYGHHIRYETLLRAQTSTLPAPAVSFPSKLRYNTVQRLQVNRLPTQYKPPFPYEAFRCSCVTNILTSTCLPISPFGYIISLFASTAAGFPSAVLTAPSYQVIEAKGRPKRNAVVVTELPYQVNKSALLQRMAEMVNDKKVSLDSASCLLLVMVASLVYVHSLHTFQRRQLGILLID